MSSSPTDVLMPKMGVSVAEGTVIEWKKSPGDAVERDETLCEVSTDKIDVEVPAPASGRFLEALVEPGATVPVGTVLARIETTAPQPGGGSTTNNGVEAPLGGRNGRGRFYSPVARRLAEAHDVPLDEVEGTGEHGRVRKRDVLDWIASHRNGEQAPAPAPLHIDSPYREEEPTVLLPSATAAPMSGMRAAIARRMLESRRTAAHCTTVVEVDFSAVMNARAALKAGAERKGFALTPLAFIARATVELLERHPGLNASVDGERIVTFHGVNLGIAVALDDGLVVPVIRDAHLLSLDGLADAIGRLAAKAREGRLEPDDLEGGTFTITNPGAFGSILATPIINQPQVAILDVEAIVKRPVVVEGPAGDAIAIRPICNLCMSWDHRALDGADAARFLGALRQRLEAWEATA